MTTETGFVYNSIGSLSINIKFSDIKTVSDISYIEKDLNDIRDKLIGLLKQKQEEKDLQQKGKTVRRFL